MPTKNMRLGEKTCVLIFQRKPLRENTSNESNVYRIVVQLRTWQSHVFSSEPIYVPSNERFG